MKRYAPLSQQPVLGRSLDQMSAGERVVCEAFSDEQYLARLLDYMALEEQKGKDKFHSDHFQLFKVRVTPSRRPPRPVITGTVVCCTCCLCVYAQGLFRNYDATFLPLVRPHLERLVRETSREKHEYSHRLAAEIIAGLVRGAKHWDFDRVSARTLLLHT